MAMSSITVKGIVPSLSILGNFQDFIFDQPTSSFKTTNIFIPTSLIPSITNWEFRNNRLSGFRFTHTTGVDDTTGILSLQNFINNSSVGDNIILIDKDFNFQINSRLVIPFGASGTRPINPKIGALRLNTDTNNLEFYSNGLWYASGSGGGGIVTSITGAPNQIIISGSADVPNISFADNPIITGNASLTIPVGTTAERPSNPVLGMIRVNSTNNAFEYYNNSTWTSSSGSSNITLTGAVSGSGSGTISTTLSNEIIVFDEYQQFLFEQSTGTFRLEASFIPTSLISAISNLEFRNSNFAGFRWIHTTDFNDTTGTLTLQSFINNSPQGDNIILIDQDFNFQINSRLVIPVGDDINRPINPKIGTLRFNVPNDSLEFFNNTWVSVGKINQIIGTLNQINISGTTEAPIIGFASNPIIPGTSYVVIPTGTTAERPTIPLFGMIRANATTSLLEYYNGTTWRTAGEAITLTGAVEGTGLGTIPTTLSNSINIVGATQNLIFVDNTICSFKINNTSTTAVSTQFIISQITDKLILGFDNTFGNGPAAYIDSTDWPLHIIFDNTIRVTFSNDGFIGIGVETPAAPIHLDNVTANKRIILWTFGNDNHQFSGFGLNGVHQLRYQIAQPQGAHIFYTGVTSTDSEELMRITGTGFVGIGTPTPNAPLQFANTTQNRKIVLWEDSDNEHQFQGFGLNGGNSIRYQVGNIAGSHVFYAATSPTSSNELFRITGEGFVGIGTPTPSAPLHFSNQLFAKKIVLSEIANNAYQYTGFNDLGNKLVYHISETDGSHIFVAGVDSSTLTELVRITGQGFIGIGTSTPHAPLQFDNTNNDRKIILSEVANNINQYNGFGVIAGNIVRYQVAGTDGSHKFYTGVNATTSYELFRIASTSVYSLVNIGIGTSTANAPLQLSNTVTRRKIVLFEGTNNDYQFTGFGLADNGQTLIYNVPDQNLGRHVFTAAINNTSDAYLAQIDINGLAVGRVLPMSIKFKSINKRQIVLKAFNDNDNGEDYSGFGLDNINTIRYQISDTTGAHKFFAGVGSGLSNELFRIAGTSVYSLINIGIGTATANAPLQFANIVQNRKIALWDVYNNNHQFTGFGINDGNSIRYQIADTIGAHIFYTGIGSGASTELMRINGNGFLGIGTSSPNAPLQFANVITRRKIVLFEGTNNDYQFIGFGIGGGNTLIHTVGASGGSHIFTAASSATAATELMRITGGGNIGIGTSTPHAPLQFANPAARRKIVLSETADNDYEFTGFGVVGTALIYNTGVTGAAHVFTTAATATSATELMRITGSGEIIADYIYADVPRFMYRLVNNTTTVTSTANTWIKIAGTTTGSLLNLFTHTDNRATYTGTRTVNMLCNVCATIFTSAGSDVSIRVYKNGTVVTPSQMTNSFTAANLRMNFNTQTIVSMATNDYLEVFIMCNTNAITLNTPFLTFTAHKI